MATLYLVAFYPDLVIAFLSLFREDTQYRPPHNLSFGSQVLLHMAETNTMTLLQLAACCSKQFSCRICGGPHTQLVQLVVFEWLHMITHFESCSWTPFVRRPGSLHVPSKTQGLVVSCWILCWILRNDPRNIKKHQETRILRMLFILQDGLHRDSLKLQDIYVESLRQAIKNPEASGHGLGTAVAGGNLIKS